MAHLVLHPVKFPPPSGELDNPDVELADPVLALSIEDEDEVAEDTPDEENVWG
jgi:hypothetical protein